MSIPTVSYNSDTEVLVPFGDDYARIPLIKLITTAIIGRTMYVIETDDGLAIVTDDTEDDDGDTDDPNAGKVYLKDLDVWIDPDSDSEGPLTVACPRCKEDVGYYCSTPRGDFLDGEEDFHKGRVDRWQRTRSA